MTSTAADPWLLNRQHAAAMAEAARQKRVCDEAEEATRQLKRSKKSAVKSAQAKEAMLAQYPNVPLSEYAPNGDHLAINIDYPGLRAVHKNPWIFLVPDLLSRDECERLMAKAEPLFKPSSWYSNGHRTSSECRLARKETVGIQTRYSKLLNMPVEHMEAAKVSRCATSPARSSRSALHSLLAHLHGHLLRFHGCLHRLRRLRHL